MRYSIRRISIRSALKIGLLLGWLVALLPALGLAAIVVIAVRGIDEAFGQITTYSISVLGQPIANIDLLALLGLADEAARVGDLAALGWGLFGALALVFILIGGAMVAITAVLFALCYNLLAAIAGGLVVELRESP